MAIYRARVYLNIRVSVHIKTIHKEYYTFYYLPPDGNFKEVYKYNADGDHIINIRHTGRIVLHPCVPSRAYSVFKVNEEIGGVADVTV